MRMFEKKFEGWYFKQRMNDYMLSFIPGRSLDGAFVQVIDSHGTKRFDMPDFKAVKDTVSVGDCVFSPRGIKIRLPGIAGDLKYGEPMTLGYDIMGPFACLPMQCRHGVVSMAHTVNGSITIGSQTYVFENGSGYIEKDSGNSFPRSYLWIQCNDFEVPCAFMMSVAHIPFGAFSFTGLICALILNGKNTSKEYRFATYNGAVFRTRKDGSIILKRGNLELEINAYPIYKGGKLAAPDRGRMNRTIHESCDAYVRLRLCRSDRIIFECDSKKAAYERSFS